MCYGPTLEGKNVCNIVCSSAYIFDCLSLKTEMFAMCIVVRGRELCPLLGQLHETWQTNSDTVVLVSLGYICHFRLLSG